ncbi:hypothetical protein ACFX14_005755 [Malus domestica]
MDFELPYSFFFLLLLLVILPFSTPAQTYNNISLGSSLTALDDNSSSWLSPSGEFAFGFLQLGVDGFLLAIWFNKIQERTIVWSANRGSLVPQGSQVELTNDGQFMLKDKTGKQISFAGSLGITGVAYAAMLDTGNFVLANKSSKYLWESFEEPTNTLLPTQILNRNSKLYASYTASNYTPGRFQFALNSDGGLLLYTTNYPLDSRNHDYWLTHTEGSGFQVIFNQSGSIYLTGTNGSVLYMLSDNTYSTQDFYHRATLEYNGVFRHSVYPKKTGSGSVGTRRQGWSSSSFIPSNLCTSFLESTGGGACGFNSLCRDGTEGPVCECPDAYSFIDKNDELKGCKQNFVSQSCDQAFPETHLFDFQEIENRDWPLSDYQHFQPVSEDWCKQSCQSDCFCSIVIFNNDECWKKGIPLINGRIDPTLGNNLKSFTYMELKGATNGFKQELGRGAFATVFKGVLASEDGKHVAVKRLDTMVRENDLEFKAEVRAIGRTNHKNLVQLLGFCNEGQHRILVYEFMSNGSLASFLFGESRPSWKNYEAKMEDEDQMILADWAYHCYEQNKLHQLFRNDDDKAKDDIEEMKTYLMIAFWCIQEDASRRPTMRNVTQMLEGTVELSNPPNPSSLYVQCKGL